MNQIPEEMKRGMHDLLQHQLALQETLKAMLVLAHSEAVDVMGSKHRCTRLLDKAIQSIPIDPVVSPEVIRRALRDDKENIDLEPARK